MRIISSFDDYYDPIQSVAMDPKLIYKRETKEVSLESIPHDNTMSQLRHVGHSSVYNKHEYKEYRNFNFSVNPFWVAFCGRIYYGGTFFFSFNTRTLSDHENGGTHGKTFYDPDALKDHWEYLTGKKYNRIDRDILRHIRSGLATFEDLTEAMKNNGTDKFWNDLAFNEIKIATGRFKRKDGRPSQLFELDSKLSDFEFYQVFDTWSAFQELAQWIGGVIPESSNETVYIKDKDLASAKGFDKWSFRKLPEKKK